MLGQGSNLDSAGQNYNVDPRLLVALAGAETDFGNNITAGQYNAFNWLYNHGTLNSPFSSWQSAINTVAKGLGGGYTTQWNLTNTATMYSQYCTSGSTCGAGLNNLNTCMAQQNADPNSLTYPAANVPRYPCH